MTNLEIHAYEITIDDEAVNNNGDNHTEIQLWSFNKLSQPILARVRDFPVFCKAELPAIFTKAGGIVSWNSDNAQDIIHLIRKKLVDKDIEEPVSIKFIKSYKLYYYTGGKKYPFLFFTFNTLKHMREVANKARYIYSSDYGKIELKFYETKIDIYNKMFSHRKVSSTERFTCQGIELLPDDPDRISKVGPKDRPFKEYIIDWKTINPLPKDSSLWFTYPIVMSFDIETYSHNHRAFPQKHYFEDIIFSISITLQTFMKPETKRDIMIIIGPTKKVKDVEVYYVKDEIEVLEKFFELVEILDPDVFIGYNIFGFDYDYMNTRLEDVGLCWKNIGRLENVDCNINELSWNSSAYGFQKLRVFNCPGRISVDMLPYIKRDHKLPMYNLSSVGKHFLGEEKFDLKPWEMFAVHKEMMDSLVVLEELTGENDYLKGIKKLKNNSKNYPLDKVSRIVKAIDKNTLIVKYNVQDTYLVTRLFEKLNVWISLIELASIFRVTPMDLFTRGQQKRCIAQLYHSASHKNIVLTTREREFIFLSGGYVSHPKVGFWPLAICFDFNSLYPSIMIAYNICFTTLLPTLKGVQKESYHHFHIEQEEPINPKPPKDDNFDYGEYDEDFDEEKNKIVGEKVTREYDLGFINQDVQKGLLPQILTDLLASRKMVKKKMKGINKRVNIVDNGILQPYRKDDSIKVKDIKSKEALDIFKEFFPDCKEGDNLKDYNEKLNKEFFSMKVNSGILDSRQLGLKVSANSLYGFTGAQVVGEFSLPEATMCVTSRGRNLIIDSGLYFEKNYGATVVYGDSILADEPLLLKINDKVTIREISSLAKNWQSYDGFKTGESNRKEKQQSIPDNIKIWSKDSWSRVKRIIRHKTNKKIYRVITDCGCVDVTEDHSLLDENWQKIKPMDCQISKTKLAYSYPTFSPSFDYDFSEIVDKEALLMGFFFDDKPYDERVIPDIILNGSLETRKAFFKGYCMVNKDIYSSSNKLKSAQLFYLIKSLGYKCSVSYKDENFVLNYQNSNQSIDKNLIRKIILIDNNYTDYVYDIETENGFYQAGIGEINIKNTDSTMVYVPSLTDYTKIYEIADVMEKDINGHPEIKDKDGNVIAPAKKGIFPPPLNLEFEKAMKALFMKKKHYAYMEYDSDGSIIKEKNSDRENLNVKGILLARRDNCQWVRKVYENVIRTIFRGEDISVSFDIIIQAIIDVIELKFDITKELSIIKSMGSNYKSRTYPLAIFHELTKEVNRPVNPGERFPFVVVEDHQGRDKMGYRMRTNELFLEQWESTPYKYGDKVPKDFKSSLGLFPPEEIDSYYYINNVLMSPIDKLFEYGHLKIIDKYDKYGYDPRFNNRLKRVSVRTPVKMVILMIRDMMEKIKKDNNADKKAVKEVLNDLISLKDWFKNIKI